MPAIAYRANSNQSFYNSANTGLSTFYFKGIKKTKRLFGHISLMVLIPIIVLFLFLTPYIILRCKAIGLDSDIKNLEKVLVSLTEKNSDLGNTVFNEISLTQITNWAQANHFVGVGDFYPLAINHINNVALIK